MPTIIDSLLVKLGLDSSGFEAGKKEVDAGLKGTGEEAESTGKKLKKTGKDGSDGFDAVGKSATKFLAMLGGTMAVKRFVIDTIESSAALNRLSQNLQTNVSEISAWSNATEIAGGTSGGLQGTMDMLSKSQTELQLTGQSGLIPFFSALGVSMATANGKARPINDMLLDLSDRLSGLDRTTAFNMGQMMGIDPGTLNLLLKGRSEVELMLKRQKEFSVVTKKQAEEASRLRRRMVESKQSFNAFGRELLSNATPALEKMFDMFSGIGDWMRDNKEFVHNFLVTLGTGLAVVGASLIPINLTVAAVVALAAGIALLKQDYDTWKSGAGETLIPWDKWSPGVEKAIERLKLLREITGDLFYRLAALIDVGISLGEGDTEQAKRAAGEVYSGSGDSGGLFKGVKEFAAGSYARTPTGFLVGKLMGMFDAPGSGGIDGASLAAAGAGPSSITGDSNNNSKTSTSTSVETNIGEVKVYTAATDAPGIANDMGKSLDYSFTAQANYGLN